VTNAVKTALITGASRGIGRAIAVSLARQGYSLTITSRTTADLAELATELERVGAPEVAYRPANMAKRQAIPPLIELHASRFKTLDALIVNAGIGTSGDLATYPINRLDKTVELNFVAATILIQKAIPLLREAAKADLDRGAKIIALSSMTGIYAERGLAVYSATKAALLSLIETVNLEESPNGVTATAIAPGYVHTDMSAWITDKVPAYTMIPVDDVAAVTNMLLGLSRTTCITKIALSRSGTSGHCA